MKKNMFVVLCLSFAINCSVNADENLIDFPQVNENSDVVAEFSSDKQKALYDAGRKDLGLPPSAIHEVKDITQKEQEAVKVDNNLPFSLTSKSLYASTLPGSKSIYIPMQRGITVALEFIDDDGNPWPVTDYTGVPSEALTIKMPKLGRKDGKNNVMSFSPTDYGRFNIQVWINGPSSPLSFVIHIRNKRIKYDRYTINIKEDSAIQIAESKIIGAPSNRDRVFESQELLDVLSGIVPAGYKKLLIPNDDKNKLGFGVLEIYVDEIDGSNVFVRTTGLMVVPPPINQTAKEGFRAFKVKNDFSIIIMKNDSDKEVEINLGSYKK